MTTPIDDFSPEELETFYEAIGRTIFNSPTACLLARHAKPMSTLRDYLDEDPTLDRPRAMARSFLVEFARIATREDTQALAVRWCGSSPAARAAASIAADMPDIDDK